MWFGFALVFALGPAQVPVECAAEDMVVKVIDEGVIEAKTTKLGTNLQLGASNIGCEKAVMVYKEIYAEFDRLEQLFDDSDASPLGLVNAGAGKSVVPVPPELYILVETAVDFAKKSGGAFDPTFAALKGLWPFDGSQKIPSDDDIKARINLVRYQDVILHPANKSIGLKREGMRLELGGIAKGYAIDRAVSILRKHGVKDFIVRSGGELFVAGKPGGKERRVGLPDPRGDSPFALVVVKDRAVNISLDNKHFFIKDGVRYHDRIDPATGRPATASRAVMVVANDATTADALSTAIFIMGPGPGMKLIEATPGVEALLVDSKNTVHLSSGIDTGNFELRAPTP